jgi:hypothetical protein
MSSDPFGIDPNRLPTDAEQMAEFERREAEYARAYQAWKDGGKVGKLPPRPIRPHIPG